METTAELAEATRSEFATTHVLLMAAAPADFKAGDRRRASCERKGSLDLQFEPTQDILGGLEPEAGQTVVGFAAEHGNDVERAREKLTRKALDLIVLNDISDPNIGFESKENSATLISSTTEAHLSQAPKDVIAEQILDRVETLRAEGQSPQPADTQSGP